MYAFLMIFIEIRRDMKYIYGFSELEREMKYN